jgi:branched-chain amino acid transport system permease protein
MTRLVTGADANRTYLGLPLHVRFKAVSILTGLALLVVLIGPFVLDPYTQSVLVRAFLLAITALTVDLLWGTTGILTFAQGAFFGIGAYAAGLMFTHVGYTVGTMMLALLAAIAVSMLVAAFVGWLAFWQGATPLYVAVVTLVLPIVVVQLIYSGGTFTGSSSGLVGFDAPTLTMTGWFWFTGTLMVLLTACAWVFIRSDYGRKLNAVRDNETRSRYLGIPTSNVKIILMMFMAALASLAGFIYACVGTIVAPEHADFVFGTELVIYVALGGRGTVLGPVIGTIGLEWASAYVSSILPFVWTIIIGAIFVVVIVVLPEGLLPPIWRTLARRLPARFVNTAKSTRATVFHPLVEIGAKSSTTSLTQPALSLTGVTKRYGHLQVLDGIDIQIMPGELVGIVGPNGAGKTTLMRCISDGMERSSGTIKVNGKSIDHKSPEGITALGLGRSFQNTSLFGSLRVSECLRLARYRHNKPSKIDTADRVGLPLAAMEVLESTGLQTQLQEQVNNLPHGMKRALELIMVLSLEPNVLLLDEPTAGLTKADRLMIGRILTDLQNRLGLAIVLIEHDFDFVKQVCSRLVVLHRGELILDGPVQEVVNSDLVQEIYSGHVE